MLACGAFIAKPWKGPTQFALIVIANFVIKKELQVMEWYVVDWVDTFHYTTYTPCPVNMESIDVWLDQIVFKDSLLYVYSDE